jgi:FkbM family methyltransferase
MNFAGWLKGKAGLFSNKYSRLGISRLKMYYLLFSKKASTLRIKNLTIHFSNGHELLHSLEEIFLNEIYKISFSGQEPFIIDCGANIGLSVLYFKTHFPQSRVVAFEPDTLNFSKLEKNCHENNLTNVTLFKQAIWTEDTVLDFSNDGSLSSKINTETNTSRTSTKVESRRLRSLLAEPVSFLKLDIEGAEYEVLKDCAHHLELVQNMFIEYHGSFSKMNELTETIQIISNNNFKFYIKEAADIYPTPFYRSRSDVAYDLQLNIFCFRL